MSIFFDNLHQLLARHFDLREESLGEQVVSVWRSMGLDVTSERALTLHMLLPNEDAATELGFRVDQLPGFISAQIVEFIEHNDARTELALTFRMRPEPAMMDTLERLICATGADLDVKADGWSSDAILQSEVAAA